MHNTELYGDLTVFASQSVKEPDAEHHSQQFANPRARLLLRNHAEAGGRDKAGGADSAHPLLATDTFTTRHMYISLYSLNGCTVTLAAQFPSEEDKTGGKKAASAASCQRAFRKQYQAEVHEKVEELARDKHGQKQYSKQLELLRLKLVRARKGRIDCPYDFVKMNLERVDYHRTREQLLLLQRQIEEQKLRIAQQRRDAM